MKNTVILFLFFFTFSFSQTVKVEYDFTVDMSGTMIAPIKQKFELINSQGKSLAIRYVVSEIKNKSLDKNGQSSIYTKIGSDTIKFYKEFDANKLFSEETIFTKAFNVKDSLSVFDWTIDNDTISILGHNCYKATTKFRGREFEAFFANDILIPDGPAKYNGLPGLILKVSILNTNSIFSIVAAKVDISPENTVIVNPYDEKKSIEFGDFKKKYTRKMNELESYNANQGITINRGGLELWENE